uniref:Cytochrome c oxidase subunit 4 n=1 Tax=Aceria tosichella TaxID=561515 RepID=A0A6G1SAG6_9ACAR
MLSAHRAARPLYRLRIGNREVVGPSVTGMDDYFDRVDQPCPPIRFKEPSDEINALREKEKGSWKNLSIDEKKKLYRYSFCQTFSEMEAPTCEGRRLVGSVLMLLSVPLVLYSIAKNTIFGPLPDSLSDEGKKRLVRWYIESRTDPMEGGISSKWDYEKNQWKEKPYLLMKSK